MTNLPTPERRTLFDLPFETARERISSLHASASASSGTTTTIPVAAGARQAPLRRLRSAVGSRLVDVGSALLADDGVPRSATRT